jgi:hypothetical protein
MTPPSTNIDGVLERATQLISAARNTDDQDERAVFAARARNAFAEAEAKLANLRINIASVERLLAPAVEAPKWTVGADRVETESEK